MGVRPGYKQTEVGVVPVEWGLVPLEAIADRIMVGIASAATHAYRDKGVPMFRNQNIKAGRLDDSDLLFIAPEYEATYKNKRLRAGDLLTMRTGYPGVTAVVPSQYESAQSFTTLITRPDPHQVDSTYLCHYINSEHGQRFFTQSQIGGAQKNVNAGTLRRMPIPLPDIAEQRAIATALSDVNALLGGLDRLIAKKRDLKQAAMQQLLAGQTRLPGFHGEWEVKPLKHFVTRDRFAIVDGPFGSQLKVDEYVESGVPVIEMEHLSDGYIKEHIERCITPRKFEDLKRSAVYPGDIIISKTGSLGKLGLMPDCVERGLITSRLAKITLDPSSADQRFVFQVLLKLRSDGYWERVSQGGTMQILGIGMLQNAPIPDIAVSEQAAIAAVLSDMDAEIEALKGRRAKTRDLKQAMMQELLTGQTRLVPVGAADA